MKPIVARRFDGKWAHVVVVAWGLVASLALGGGCATYRFGAASFFPSGIRTIYVPIVRNDTFRHDLGVQLTDALVREIESRTPYKVTGDPSADSTLVCRVVDETKVVLTETNGDDPRALDASVLVRATWTGRAGEVLMRDIPIAADGAVGLGQTSRFVPEAGQSVDTATQEAIEDLARRIVSQMEMRW